MYVLLRTKTVFLPLYAVQCTQCIFLNMWFCFLKMHCLEEPALNLSMIVRSLKHHFVFLFVTMDFKLLNCQICSQTEGLFVSAWWNHSFYFTALFSSAWHCVEHFTFVVSFNPYHSFAYEETGSRSAISPHSGSANREQSRNPSWSLLVPATPCIVGL